MSVVVIAINNKTFDKSYKKYRNQFYNLNTKHYTITKSNHNNSISDLFLSCSYEKTIKVWKY